MSDTHIGIYVRVSSKQQDQASQLPDLERWAKAQNEPVVWYRDKFTGKSLERPGWMKLVKAKQAGKLSKIACWRLDRLGRTASGLTKLFDELIADKIPLVSLREGFDLSTPAGKLMATMLAGVAQYETEVRSERQLAGIAAAKAAGRTWGGSKKGRRLSVTPEQEKAVKAMRGEKVAVIARTVGLSRPTIYRLLEA